MQQYTCDYVYPGRLTPDDYIQSLCIVYPASCWINITGTIRALHDPYRQLQKCY